MSKYSSYQRTTDLRRRNEPHPVWRGIGCAIILIVPVLSFFLSKIAVDYAVDQGIRLPTELSGYPVMPDWLYFVPGFVGILRWIEGRYNLYAYLVMAFFMAVFLGGVLSLLYAVLYRVVGPPRYTPLDAPPVNIKVKKYKR